MKKWNQNWTMPFKTLLAGASISAAALLVPMVVSAVAPPANTKIGNQASADYKDNSGRAQTAQSNLVETTVAQVGALALTNDNTKSAAAGNTVYMSHQLINNGNGTDSFKITAVDGATLGTFSNIAIYPDADGNGIPSSLVPLCATPQASGSSVPLCDATGGFTQTLSANSTFNFVVAYTIPGTATSPTTPFNTATVTATAATPALYGTSSVSRTDTVNLTSEAAFTATKAIAAPAVPAPSGSWPSAMKSGKPSPASCDNKITWSTTLLADNPSCNYTVYTITYSNTGGAAGAFSMVDTLPAGMTYVSGSAVWSGLGGVALKEDGSANSNPAITSSYSAGTFKATVTGVNSGVNGSISFVVLINKNATVGQTATTNTAGYWTTTCNPANAIGASNCGNTSTPPASTSSAFTITASYGVVAANVASTTPDAATPPAKAGENIVTKPKVSPGGYVDFEDYITNTGLATDTFNVKVADVGSTNNNFPSGTVFSFLKVGGAPLLDSNGDGIKDTGPLEPGATYVVVVRATLPTNAVIGSGPLDALLTATSVGNGPAIPLVADAVWNRVTTVEQQVAQLDLTNTAAGNKASTDGITFVDCTPGVNCDLGQGPSTGPTDTVSTTPGTGALFPIFVKNNGTSSTDYNLTASIPTGWTVKFVDASGTCSSAALTQPLTVTAGAQVELKACVTPPVGTLAGTTVVDFTATSTTTASITDTVRDAVKVNPVVVRSMTLGPDTGTNSVASNGTVVQPVLLTNTGTELCGASSGSTPNGFNVAVAMDTPGWTASVYFDKSPLGVIGVEDTLLGAPTLSGAGNLTTTIAGSLVALQPGQSLPLLVKVFAPANAASGAVATATLTVTDANDTVAARCPTQTGTYTSTVVSGQLHITKTQAKDASCLGTVSVFSADALSIKPTECIVYKVVASNDGKAAVTNVVLKDAVPAYTTYTASPGVQPAVHCEVVNGSGTASFSPPVAPSTALSCQDAASPTGLTLNAGGSLTMYFSVQVQN